jgi:peptidoglycan/LPS O-acetylase OafA/YrhL
VLSGFIMTIVYAELSPRGAPAYWLARFARIYPVYMLGLFLFVWVTGTWNWKAVGLNLLLLQAWVPRFALSGNSVGWSLSVEAWFYLLFPPLIGLSRRIGPARWTALVAACWVVTQVWVSWMVEVHYTGFPSAIHDLIFYFPPGHLSTFLVGMTAAMFVRGTAWRPPAGQALALGAAATAFVVYFLAARPVPVFLDSRFLAPVFAAAVIALYHIPVPFLTAKPLRFLGEASYSVYIFQHSTMIVTTSFIAPRLHLSPTQAFWAGVCLLVAGSCLVLAFVEAPARGFIKSAGAGMLSVWVTLRARTGNEPAR